MSDNSDRLSLAHLDRLIKHARQQQQLPDKPLLVAPSEEMAELCRREFGSGVHVIVQRHLPPNVS